MAFPRNSSTTFGASSIFKKRELKFQLSIAENTHTIGCGDYTNTYDITIDESDFSEDWLDPAWVIDEQEQEYRQKVYAYEKNEKQKEKKQCREIHRDIMCSPTWRGRFRYTNDTIIKVQIVQESEPAKESEEIKKKKSWNAWFLYGIVKTLYIKHSSWKRKKNNTFMVSTS